MRNTELYFAQKYCWDHRIYVVVKTTPRVGKYKLAISTAGREKIGNEVYESGFSTKIVDGHRVQVPPLHVKIAELYITIYKTNTKKSGETPLQAAS